MKKLSRLRILLICFGIALTLIPMMIVGITGNGFGEIASHTLMSLSILSFIGAALLGINRQDKKNFFKICVSIGLLIVLVKVWL